MHALVAGRDDAAALPALSPSHVVTMPPAPSMIGISATMSCGFKPLSMTRSTWPAASMQ